MLASIQKIEKLESIPNADKIETASVLGWKCVVQKGEFKEGDSCVYITIDSIVPDIPQFSFMKDRHFRVKTIKLRGQISCGLSLPVSLFPNLGNLAIGADVTDLLGIVHYYKPIPAQLAGKIKGDFPGFLRKTDEERVQNVPGFLDRHKDKTFYVTEKLNGTSATYYFKEGQFGVCTRNLELIEDESNIYWKVSKELDLPNKMAAWGNDFSIQGELAGMGIQKNPYNLPNVQFFAFQIFDIKNHRYLDFKDFQNMCEKWGVQIVPILETDFVLKHTMEELIEKSKGTSTLNPKILREGIVLRGIVEDRDEEVGRVSIKAVNPDYLLKNKE